MLGALATLLAACTIGGVPAQCGRVAVPESRALPNGPQISLNVAVLPATGARRADPLFFVTGGPGGIATEELPAISRLFAAVNDHRDVVFVDQRGVGDSNPLTCKVATQTTSVAELVRACLGLIGADVTQYRTPDAMDDLDAVRRALGYGRIDLFGISYGATAVQVYLRRHPDTVRAAIMDGATLLDVPVFEKWSSNGQRALQLLHKRCHAEKACRTALPTWYEKFPALLTRLARKPVRVEGITVNASAVASTVETMTASVGDAVRVPWAIAQAERGRYVPIARETLYVAMADQELAVQPVAVMCTEPWAVNDPAAVYADARGTYLAHFQPAYALSMKEICDAWPTVDTSREDWSRVRSDAPALVLVGGADPKDPPANTAGVEQAMPNAKVVTVPGGAHGVATLGCLPRLLDRFLEQGTAAGLDTSCAAKALVPYPSFRVR